MPRALLLREECIMHFQRSLPMELVIVLALGFVVIALIVAMQEPAGDRTRFTVEQSEATHVIGERREPLPAEETPLGR